MGSDVKAKRVNDVRGVSETAGTSARIAEDQQLSAEMAMQQVMGQPSARPK